jgi:hypothetical protein
MSSLPELRYQDGLIALRVGSKALIGSALSLVAAGLLAPTEI